MKTPRQKRKATAKSLERLLPEKPQRGGETVVSNADLRRAIRDLRR